MLNISYNTLSTSILSFTRDTLFLVVNYIGSGQPEFQSLWNSIKSYFKVYRQTDEYIFIYKYFYISFFNFEV